MRRDATPADPARPPSPVELLHPDGFVERALVLGGGCPATLRRGLPEEGEGDAGLVVLAPTADEARDRGRLRDTVREAAGELAPDGLVYALARRGAALGLLEGEGLERAAALVHLPRGESPRLLVSAEPRALRHALSTLLPPTPRRRLAAAAASFLSASAVVMRPPGARPLLDWLRALTPDADPACTILAPTWRQDGGSTVLHVFGRTGETPFAVAKIGAAAADERGPLASVASAARVAGVDTPAPLGTVGVGAAQALVTTAVAGRPAAWELARRPARAVDLLDRVAAWLGAWNRATRVPGAFSRAEVEERLLEPARTLAPHLPDAGSYLAWLGDLCALLEPVPAVAAHNDLTTANLLVAGARRLSVVDWEAARARDLPLRDLVYAIVDAYLAAGRHGTRTAVFDACFAGSGEPAATAERLVARHRAALGLDGPAAAACFHACWLEHAANSLREGPAEDGAFVAIAARLAREREALAKRLGR